MFWVSIEPQLFSYKSDTLRLDHCTIINNEKALRQCKPPSGRHIEFQSFDHSISDMPFLIGGPLEPSLYLQPFSRYSAQKKRYQTKNQLTNQPMTQRTSQQTRRIATSPVVGNNEKQCINRYSDACENRWLRTLSMANKLHVSHVSTFKKRFWKGLNSEHVLRISDNRVAVKMSE